VTAGAANEKKDLWPSKWHLFRRAPDTHVLGTSAHEEAVMKPELKIATFRSLVAILCAILLVPGDSLAYRPQQSSPPASSSGSQTARIPPEQLDSLVAPIALYPDPLLAQVLAASTYPLEIILLQRWLEKNKNLKDKELADAVAKQSWDPSVQALAALPEVVKRLGDEIQWTTDLGNAFLAQQSDVMDAVQRMRKKAHDKDSLKSTEQQKVETRVVESKSVIVIEQANPQVVYVPSYNPVVVFGPAYYPYPPIYYPPWGYYAAGAAISFGFGVMMGAFWSGGWGWGCGWGGNNVYINHNSNFNRNTNISGGNRVSNLPARGGGGNGIGGNRPSTLPARGGGDLGGNRASTLPAGGGSGVGGGRSNWAHNPEHRGGTPYRDRATADRFGGAARGDSLAQRRASAQQRIARQGGNLAGSRGAGGMFGSGSAGAGGAGVANRASGSGFGGGAGLGGADRIGSRDLSRSGGGDRNAFGGGSRGFNGSSARSSSSRGSSSFGSRGGGGFSRGGGGFRGGGRRR
jgi:hypothetical protein